MESGNFFCLSLSLSPVIFPSVLSSSFIILFYSPMPILTTAATSLYRLYFYSILEPVVDDNGSFSFILSHFF